MSHQLTKSFLSSKSAPFLDWFLYSEESIDGRAGRIWLDMIFRKRLKKCVDWSKVDKHAYLEAMSESVYDPSAIKTLLASSLSDSINDVSFFMKGIDYSYYYEENRPAACALTARIVFSGELASPSSNRTP